MPATLTGLILIVDDLPTNLAVICEALSGVGLEVAIATSGERALQQIAREQPDLILLDLLMPGLNGFETCQRLKANPSTHDIPVIFMTALADTESKVMALELGAVDYVTKPFQEQEVLARVRTHLQLSRLTQTLEQSVHEATAALQASRVAEDARKAAIAREQEKAAQERAAELAKANVVLRRATDRLASKPSLEAFLEHVLTEACQEAIEAGAIFLYDEAQDHLLPVVSHGFNADYPYPIQQAIPTAEFPTWSRLLHTKQPILVDMDEQPELFAEDTLAWHRAQGHQRIIVIALMLGERPLGVFGIAFCNTVRFKETDLELFQALAQQATLAIQLTRLAEEAKQAAVAREQEQAAQARAAELAKANTALQRMIDALTAIDDLDEFVPATLRIVAQTFGTENCAFYEHGDKAPIYLRYWLMGDRVLRPNDLVTLDSESFATVRRLAAGFTVPDAHLGTPVRNRTRAVILDHTCGTSEPEFHEFACKHGWATELNVPLVVDGYAEGALLIYRPAGTTYTSAEIGLAEALGKQLALAMQASRLATEKRSQAVETAIAREQEQAAQERAAELAKANEALRRGVERLAEVGNIDALLDSFLLEAMTVTGASAGAVFDRVADTEFRMRSLAQDGRLINSADTDAFGSILREVSAHDPVGVFRQIIEAQVYCHDVDDYYAAWFPEAAAFHRQQGNQVTWNFPFRVGDKVVGFLGLAFREKRWPNQVMSETVQALGHQVSLALETLRLAEAAKQAAIAREQEQAAQERAAELAKANDALKQTVDVMVRELNLDNFLAQVLLVVNQHLDTPGSMLWLYDFEAGVINLHLACISDIIYRQELPSYGSSVHRTQFPITINGDAAHLIQGNPLVTLDLPEILDPALDAGTREWLRDHKVISVLRVPLSVGERVIGNLMIHKEDNEPFSVEKVELAKALGQQAALSIHITQLAEEAKQAAIAREQEKAAQEQAAALAKVNAALQAEIIERDRAERSARGQAEALVSMLSAFAAAPVLDNFLGIVLQAIVEQIGGHSGGIWLYDDCQNTSILHLNYEDGQIQQGSQITRPGTKPDFLKQWDRDYLSALKQQKLLVQDRRQPIDSPAYADYHTYNQQRGIKMILVVALFFGETFLGNITLRCTDYRDCKPEELALIQALAQQAALVIQLTRLAEQSKQAAILEERNRMAREIHDTLAQSFTSIRMQLEAAIRLLNCKPEQAQACITFAQELAKSGLAEARRSVWALQPEAEDYRHLSTTLQHLAAQQTAETSIQVEVAIVGTPYALPPDVGMNLLRIGQEALNNALHHAFAQTMLTLTYDPHQVQLQIQDDGQGFDPQLESSGGFGLISMEQRSDRLGGTFTINSQPGHGTEIRVTVPILEDRGSESTPIN